MRIATIDSSPLINLAYLGLCNELSLFFDRVLVPSAVQREVNRKHRFKYVLKKLYKTGFFVRCLAADAISVDLLRAEAAIGEGEAEALTQAQQRAATFFIGDEIRAREVGETNGLTCVGTVRLLARLNREDRAPDTRDLVRTLQRELSFRVTSEVVDLAISMADRPI